jgi:hypothetical protein
MRSEKQISMVALMWLVVVAALQLALFQDVWFVVLFPPVSMAVLALNLGFFFLMVRPKLLKTRVMGVLLASVATSLGMSVFAGLSTSNPGKPGVWRKAMEDAFTVWADSLPNQQSPKALVLRFLTAHSIVIQFILLDLIGVAMIYCGGWVQHWLRHAEATNAEQPSPLDERAATPL